MSVLHDSADLSSTNSLVLDFRLPGFSATGRVLALLLGVDTAAKRLIQREASGQLLWRYETNFFPGACPQSEGGVWGLETPTKCSNDYPATHQPCCLRPQLTYGHQT